MGATYDFSGRCALVTGGARGIGKAAAERLGGFGARVAVFDRKPADEGLSIEGDISSSAEVNAAVRRVEDERGSIDILVNSAGVAGDSLRTVDMSDEEWRH